MCRIRIHGRDQQSAAPPPPRLLLPSPPLTAPPPNPQIRNSQLDKEAGELRLENESLLQQQEDLRRAAVQGAEASALAAMCTAPSAARDVLSLPATSPQLAALQEQLTDLQAELTQAYKARLGWSVCGPAVWLCAPLHCCCSCAPDAPPMREPPSGQGRASRGVAAGHTPVGGCAGHC